MRLLIASILCGPLAGLGIVGFIGLIAILMNAGSGFGTGGMLEVSMFLSGAVFGAGIGWPAMLVFGLPAHAFLYRRRSYRIGGYLLAGAILGLLAAAIIALLQFTLSGDGGAVAQVVMAGGMLTLMLMIASVGAASLFWAIRRPDRDVIPPEKLAASFE
jgi:hypothetical protein